MMNHIQLMSNYNNSNYNERSSIEKKSDMYHKRLHYDNDDDAAASSPQSIRKGIAVEKKYQKNHYHLKKKKSNKKLMNNSGAHNMYYQPPPSFGGKKFTDNSLLSKLQPPQQQGLLERTKSNDTIFRRHPSRRRDSGKDIQIFPAEFRRNSMGNMKAAEEEIDNYHSTSSPSISTRSIPASSTLHSTGTNLYNYYTSSLLGEGETNNDDSNNSYVDFATMSDTPPAEDNFVHDERDSKNSIGDRFCFLSYNYHQKGINYPLRQLLSNMSSDSLFIIENDEDKSGSGTSIPHDTYREKHPPPQQQAIRIIQES